MASVSLRGLTKIFLPPTAVLDNVNLDVRDSEFVSILGPSGCGKSTILRCLAGLEPPTAGDLLIGDRRVNDLPPAERDVAMVFQNYALYPHFTVRENLEFPLRMRGMAVAERAERVEAVAARLELGALLKRMPAELSGGQRQRVALGRALVREPAVFLFDEPLSNLDAALRVQLRAELMELHAALRVTMLYVTHDQAEALTMGERVVVLHQGRIQQAGTPAEVYQRPTNRFVARFVGTPGMNVIEGSGGLRLATEPPPGATHMGVRPENLRLTEPGSGAGDATVELVERLGSETLVHVRLSPLVRVVVRVPGLAPFHSGDRIAIAVDAEHLHWFGADGQRLLS